ncbi:hypothetical protein Pan153_35790 [Gimesia panareensis]|uniref:Uncharacterized protein n=1 Tax=Gimesia panareensis TaxID=2527978 RepID=A0A518FRE7_9PLAN|nr:hypothetical protein [Gimesia panareensis]QDV18918.1 hypothetical protein Pan153_35790 [Gimesia panareensis]
MSTITIDAPEARPLYPSTTAHHQTQIQSIVKTIIWTAGAIIFCLAMFDFYAQTYAHETEIALQQAQAEKLDLNQDLRLNDIAPYIAGAPIISTRPADKYTHMCKEMKQYTWKGFFKNYTLSLYVGLGENPSIDYVHGPGNVTEESHRPIAPKINHIVDLD